jgi:hypothetical protein
MKKILSAIFFFGWMRVARAQGAPQAILEQIVALKGYITTAEDGTKIAKMGLSAIQKIRNEEFQLHRVFFGSLETINPIARYTPEVFEIIQLQESLINMFGIALTRWQGSAWLHGQELSCAASFYRNVVQTSAKYTKDLHSLITEQDYKMTDGERVWDIQNLLDIVEDQDKLVKNFISSTDWLIDQRKREYQYTEKIKRLFKLP